MFGFFFVESSVMNNHIMVIHIYFVYYIQAVDLKGEYVYIYHHASYPVSKGTPFYPYTPLYDGECR